MNIHSFRADDPISRPRSYTPPPIQEAVEYLSSSTLVQNISILLSIPRETTHLNNAHKSGSKVKRPGRGPFRPRKSNGKAARPAALTTGQHSRHISLNVPQSPIDTLAAVASAESFLGDERPTKRARSEKLTSPSQLGNRYSTTSSRPATSYLTSNSWDNRPESALGSGTSLISPRIDYTRDEQLVADSLLDLFRRVPSSPAFHASQDAKDELHIPQAHSSQEKTGIWIMNAHDRFEQQLSRPFDQSETKTIAKSSPRTTSAQTRTPPEDSDINHGAPLMKMKSVTANLSDDVTMTETLEIASPELPSHVTQPQQLHSPQSLSADVDKIKVKKRRGRIKREPIEGNHGLGISVANSESQQVQNGNIFGPSMLGVNVTTCVEANVVQPTAADGNSQVDEETKCVKCGFFANSLTGDTMDWLQCNGCSGWLHFACTGFSKKEIERIDKFHCAACRANHGPTTFVRKSARNRTNVDYSSLNEGFFSTVEEHHEHRYVKHFKARDMKHILQESFPRIAPEDLTLEYLERLPAMDEPIVIPRALNPRPWNRQTVVLTSDGTSLLVPEQEEEDFEEQEVIEDMAQDKLGMVIPEGLTVRRVAEIHGADLPLEVIDVKMQEGDSRKWTVGKWADYYEAPGDKAIRNVISLEVSYSPLGKLLRRPTIVRDLDLQDAVWPDSDTVRKAVKFYVLMSVSDCYTDFHIDFGGSSVYYHVLKGKKVFFFIPPSKQNLKKYEEWCISPAQSETFLPDQTKQCYRIDLEEGDTMLIPSGWIHAVWTPEDSLVIGGNFLTKLHLGMQLRINELEKNTGVETKFRYPFFQKVQWYTVAKYLKEDPLPSEAEEQLMAGSTSDQRRPIWHLAEAGSNQDTVRYYAKAEVEGWPELLHFIFRTVLIHLDRLEGVTKKTRAAVSRSIPKSINDPLSTARQFACWIAWKNGNERVADWVLLGSVLPTRLDVKTEKQEKVSTVQLESRTTRRATSTNVEAKTSHRLGPKKVVCDNCREKKVACKHVDAHTLAKLTEADSPSLVEDINERDLNGDGVISKQRDREIVGRLSVNSDGKRRWGKACVECRRSKRRCIHDEAGKIDPHKQKQLAAALREHAQNGVDIDDYDEEMLVEYGSDEIEIDPALLNLGNNLVDTTTDEDLIDQLVKAASDNDHNLTATTEVHSHSESTTITILEAAVSKQNQDSDGQDLQRLVNGSGIQLYESDSERGSDTIAIANGNDTPSHAVSMTKVENGLNRQSLSPTISKKPRKGSKEPTALPQPLTLEEEESLKIAMELQAQEFGLRSRRSAGS